MSFIFNDPTVDSNGIYTDFNNNKATSNLIRTSNYFPRCFKAAITGSATTLTVNNIMQGELNRSFTGTTVSDTLPTAAQIITEMKSRHPLGNSIPVNTGFEFIVYYTADNDGGFYSFTGNTGITVLGENNLDKNKGSLILVIATNVSSGSEAVSVIWTNGEV